MRRTVLSAVFVVLLLVSVAARAWPAPEQGICLHGLDARAGGGSASLAHLCSPG